MRIASAARGDEFEINVISLIDVMLTLLMFFVVTATFEQKALMKVALPQASAAPTSARDEALTVLIDKDGHFFVGPNEVLNPGIDTLKAAIQGAAGDDRSRQVTLRADGRTPHQSVITVMEAARRIGLSHVTFATQSAAQAGKN